MEKNPKHQLLMLVLACVLVRSDGEQIKNIKGKTAKGKKNVQRIIFLSQVIFRLKRQLKHNAMSHAELLSLRINRVKLLLARSSRTKKCIRHAASISYYTKALSQQNLHDKKITKEK